MRVSAVTVGVIITIGTASITDPRPSWVSFSQVPTHSVPTRPYEGDTVIVYVFRMRKLRHRVVNNLPCKEWGCISNPGSLAPALIIRVPDETGLFRLEKNDRPLDGNFDVGEKHPLSVTY